MDHTDWDKRYAETPSVWSSTANEFVMEHLANLPAGKMIDIAGGEGRNALWFARRGWQVENVDFSQVALEKFLARASDENIRENCTATRADATLPTFYALSPAHLVVMAYLQITTGELMAAITHGAQALVPGGTFFGVWHARENLSNGYGGPQSPDVLPTQTELHSHAEAAGLTDISVKLVERDVTVDSLDHTAIDVILMGTRKSLS